jgi:hypothetical protein
MASKLKNVENETQTLYDLEYGKTTGKHGKWDTHTVGPEYGEKTQNRRKWETHMIWTGIWQETLKNVENEKCSLYDFWYGEKKKKNCENEKHTL